MVSQSKKERFTPYILVAPALLMLLLTVGYPIVYNIYTSMHDWYILSSRKPENFVLFENFLNFFRDDKFWNSVGVTLKFTGLAVSLEFLLGLTLALALNKVTSGRKIFRTLLITPLMSTPLVVGLIWRLLWHSDYGIINFFIERVGFDSVAWLSYKGTAFFALLITELWQNTSFVFLVLYAAIQMLPVEPYESAVVDGAGWWRQQWYITLPLLRIPILIAIMFRLMFTIRLFDQVWALTRGGPQSATMTLSMLIYKTGFQQFKAGQSATLSILLLIITMILTFFLVKFFYKENTE